ncbi:MAG: PQQ-dependent sugar dehydrogenase [Rhodocyclaceae bacterium]|nr:PQQ-dependent sugar dehydrogenase [Pseudomonadota bacterium]MDQ7974658.1 PQQ-dependent sugar dehydrogenase [Rhodocyclaceae bacterium]MDQ8002649.1 PQQ-dependent sugar dehydrogenase [Pseudomonadota bacterium]MDQ8015351.1 PQQ-dependent sugar dehydrogenase [Pseudomonadota bacterium]
MWLGLAWAGMAVAQAPVRTEVVTSGLENPWALAFLPGGRFLVTEKPGRMRVVEPGGRLNEALQGLPPIAAGGQGGLLDVVTDSAFASNRTVYFCYSEPDAGGSANSTALAKAQLSTDRTRLENVQVLFSQKPKVASRHHFGCRIVEMPDGTLFMTLGDRFSRKEDAQTLDNHLGKVIRIQKDGKAPADNPFVHRAGALPEIWSYGHRNGQGATLGPDGKFWMHEHGPQGGDEINVPQGGRNYGWPVITYGENYGGGKIGDGLTAKAGMEQPLKYWVPSIAPSGMAFLTSDRYGAAWKGNLFVGSLKFGYLDRIELKDGKVVAEHKLLEDGRERIRDVRQGPDGLLYVLTDAQDGKLIRLQPR